MSELTRSPAVESEFAPQPADKPVQREVRLPYMAALDGLRALAAVVVLLYHADMPWMPGGFLGVEVFFVLSGYLITSLLLAEWRQTGRVALVRFWLRRVRRLYPAMLLMTAASITYAVVFLPDEVAGMGNDAVAGLGYMTNWYLIFSRTSYFESVGRPSLLRHLWSLAIEGQLYVVWPLAFVLLIRRWKGRWAPLMAFLGACASAALMAWLYQPDVDPSRVYYGTDTRACGFLLGAALAFAPLARRSAKGIGPWLSDLAGLASLGLLAWSCVAINAYQPLLYRGGLGIVAVSTVLVISAVARPGTRLVPGLLGWGPLRWIGLRSYGIYLWHWPVFMLTRPQLDLPLSGIPLLILRLAATFVLTEISYRCVEKPLRLGALGRARQAYGQARGSRRLALGLRWGGAFAAMAVASVVLGRAVVNSQPSTPSWYVGTESVRTVLSSPTAQASKGDGMAAAEAASPTLAASHVEPAPSATAQSPSETLAPSPTVRAADTLSPAALASSVDFGSTLPNLESPEQPSPTPGSSMGDGSAAPSPAPTEVAAAFAASPSPEASPSPASSATPSPETLPTAAPLSMPTPVPTSEPEAAPEPSPTPVADPQNTMRVIAIGDSVMVSAADQLMQSIDGLSIDAAIGRQMREVIEVLQAIADAGQMGDVVIVQVGNNGYLSAKKFDEMMALLKDVRSVVILNCRVPRQWEETVNTVLAEGVERHPNATLVDWYAASAEHPEFFWNDGMHLRPEGAKAYAELVERQVEILSR